MPGLSAVIIAKDEEKRIAECLRALKFCDERVVVDSGSSDRTAEIARAEGALVYSNPFKDFASQKNFGISKASSDWVLLIDADECVTEELAREVLKEIGSPALAAYMLPRKNQIFGRWMSFGANRGDKQLRLVRREKAVFEGLVHERVRYGGPVRVLKAPLLHNSTASITEYMNKLNVYTGLESAVLESRGLSADEEKMKRRPCQLFLYRYFLQAAILDGIEGFLFTVLSSYYEFIRLAKQWERQNVAEKKI